MQSTTVLLGPGTSVTQAAMRELSKAGVMVGFCGGGGTPLFTATEPPLKNIDKNSQCEDDNSQRSSQCFPTLFLYRRRIFFHIGLIIALLWV